VPAEPLAELLLLDLAVGRVPLDGARVSLQQVGHEDAILRVLVGRRQDVGALDGLVEVAEDVVHGHYPALGGLRTRHVRLEAAEVVGVGAFRGVAFCHYRGDVAAGFVVAVGCFHGGHFGG
jgi:hypothetical protein